MSAITALIFIGQSHPNDGGLRPSIFIQLDEGCRPCFIFSQLAGGQTAPAFKMIPTIEFMLDDLILMIAYALIKVPEIVAAVNLFTSENITARRHLEMYTDLTEQQRLDLYALLKSNKDLPKIGICLFKGSSLENCIDHLNNYSMECEVSQSVFVRSFSSWGKTWETSGVLQSIRI